MFSTNLFNLANLDFFFSQFILKSKYFSKETFQCVVAHSLGKVEFEEASYEYILSL